VLPQACFELEANYCPPITFVVVQKRHNTRLFPVGRERDRSGNCLPGTVVDKGICHPTQFDFFLNSHAGLQGHNKPAHYHVLVDENGFSADGLQLFTYWQCFLYCRCTRWVCFGLGWEGSCWECLVSLSLDLHLPGPLEKQCVHADSSPTPTSWLLVLLDKDDEGIVLMDSPVL
jgi:hypothetical protein